MFSRTIAVGFILVGLASDGCFAQQWEIGGAGGYGYPLYRSVSNGFFHGDAGFRKGAAFSAVAGEDLFQHLSGEVRYTYRQSDPSVKSDGAENAIKGDSHAVHYDMLIHPTRRDASIRPFFAAGGGIKVYRGTAPPTGIQTLSVLANLAPVSETKPMFDAGFGVRVRAGRHAAVRFDVRDYMTPFPTNVVVPATRARLRGWVHDIVGLVGLSGVF